MVGEAVGEVEDEQVPRAEVHQCGQYAERGVMDCHQTYLGLINIMLEDDLDIETTDLAGKLEVLVEVVVEVDMFPIRPILKLKGLQIQEDEDEIEKVVALELLLSVMKYYNLSEKLHL